MLPRTHIALVIFSVIAILATSVLLAFEYCSIAPVIMSYCFFGAACLSGKLVNFDKKPTRSKEVPVHVVMMCPDDVRRSVRVGMYDEANARNLYALRQFGFVKVGKSFPFNIDVPYHVLKAPVVKPHEAVERIGRRRCKDLLNTFGNYGGILDAGLYRCTERRR